MGWWIELTLAPTGAAGMVRFAKSMTSELHTLLVSIDEQSLRLMSGAECLATYPVSTSAKGMGFQEGSYRTPTGRFRICEKIGDGEPVGTIFKGRVPAGMWDGRESENDLILTRILRLEGLDEENRNTYDRYVYVHGTNQESKVGKPAGHGCVRLSNNGMLALFDQVNVGDELIIEPATQKSGKLMFIDCDSTLSVIEGIDELGRSRGEEVFEQVEALTNAAMNGEIPISDVFPKRMELIQPDREVCDRIAQQYIEQMVEGVDQLIEEARDRGWEPVILSGGFAPLIKPLAERLGIANVEAVPIHLNEDGSYAGYGDDYPTTRNHGKNEVIREWKSAMLPEQVIMIGDGVSDLETQTDVDCFIGFGGVVERKPVRDGCDYWLEDMCERDAFWDVIDSLKTS